METGNKQKVWDFANNLRGIIPFFGFSVRAVELIFMKHISEFTFDDKYLQNYFKEFLAYKDMFVEKVFQADVVKSVYNIVEEIYNIESGLLVRTVDDLENLFNEKENSEQIFKVLNEFKMPSLADERTEWLEKILEYGESKDISKNAIYSTNSSLIKLVSKILAVKQDETFMDCFSGFSKSSLRIDAANYLGYEINPQVAAIANMLMILSGKKRFSIKNQNFFFNKLGEIADKIFSDGPIGGMLSPEESHFLGGASKRSDYHMLKKAATHLKLNGKAVVTCPSGVLFGDVYRRLREQLTFKHLTAVISLPPLWNNSNAETNLIVLENRRRGEDVMMIDASSSDCFSKIDKKTVALTDEAIDKIISALNGEVVEGFSEKVTIHKILKASDRQTWAPSYYIRKKPDIEFRPSSEVKRELAEIYKKLAIALNK
jgi:type I restriction-modification system DNA methylase subunit